MFYNYHFLYSKTTTTTTKHKYKRIAPTTLKYPLLFDLFTLAKKKSNNACTSIHHTDSDVSKKFSSSEFFCPKCSSVTSKSGHLIIMFGDYKVFKPHRGASCAKRHTHISRPKLFWNQSLIVCLNSPRKLPFVTISEPYGNDSLGEVREKFFMFNLIPCSNLI